MVLWRETRGRKDHEYPTQKKNNYLPIEMLRTGSAIG